MSSSPSGARGTRHSAANLKQIYSGRFDESDARAKDAIWKEICAYLQRWVPEDGAVLDLACDRGDFIRNIKAGERWGTDLRDVSDHLGVQSGPEVKFVQGDGLELADKLPNEHFDAIFMSNYLEHLPSAEHVIEQFRVARRLLKPGGRVIVMQPNIRLVGGRYWDFIDHSVALTERSLVEAGELAELVPEQVITRFLPYTTKSALPKSPRLVRWYLRLRPAWLLLGKQTLYIGRRDG